MESLSGDRKSGIRFNKSPCCLDSREKRLLPLDATTKTSSTIWLLIHPAMNTQASKRVTQPIFRRHPRKNSPMIGCAPRSRDSTRAPVVSGIQPRESNRFGRRIDRLAAQWGENAITGFWRGEGVNRKAMKNPTGGRHSTPSQLAMSGARAREMYDREAKDRMSNGGKAAGKNRPSQGVVNLPHPIGEKSRDAVGKTFGVSGKSITKAEAVLERATEEIKTAMLATTSLRHRSTRKQSI
jgi:hypothetical protein